MVAYLKASSNEKMYSDYLQVAWEAEKEEAMEASHNLPLWKLKNSQPAVTPSTWVPHLEESANKEEYVNGEDPDGIKGINGEFIACLPRTVETL